MTLMKAFKRKKKNRSTSSSNLFYELFKGKKNSDNNKNFGKKINISRSFLKCVSEYDYIFYN